MTIRDVSLWLLKVGFMIGLAPAAMMAQGQVHTSVKRGDDPMFRVMWSPPPPDTTWIMNEAQWGLPSAPFVFSGDTLFIGGSFESARPVLIDRQARIHTAPDTRFHLSGTIDRQGTSGAGLVKDGAGTLVLSGQNAYRGNTIVEEGTLHVLGDMALGQWARTLELYGGTTLSYGDAATVFNNIQLREHAGTDSLTWRVDTGTAKQIGIVNGHVPIIKKGAGTLIVAGVVHFPSSAIVDEGTLAITDTFGGSVQLNRGARLEGRGTVGSATVLDGGVLAAGVDADPSTLFITRTLEFQPGAKLEIDVQPGGASDRVHVSGKALLAGEVHALAASGDWQPRTDYAILRAEQGFDDTRFDAATTSLPFLQASLSYDAQEVTLRLDRNATPLDEVAETPTEEEVADALEADENPVLIDPIVRMDAGEARHAFNQLSGSWSASVLSSLLEDSRFVREAALRHGGPAESVLRGASLHDVARPAGFWHEAFFSSADRRADGALPADGRDTGGLVLGRTYDLNPAWRANAFFAVQRSDLAQRRGGGTEATANSGAWAAREAGATASADSLHVGLGLGGRWRGVDVAMGTAYAWNKIRSQRRIAIAGLHDVLTGRYSAETLQLFAEISAPLRWLTRQGQALAERARHGPPYTLDPATPVFRPYLRFAWVQASTKSYTEHGGAAALRVQGERRGVLFTGVGLKASHTVSTGNGMAHVEGEVGWRHAGGDVRAWSRQRFHNAVAGRTFASEGHAVARQAWQLRLAVQGDLARHVKLGVAYDGQFSRGVQDHGARLDMRWTF
ncbi:MAG TPA: autotransporter domain-containing protein [Burkholderiaceae bacterium]|nr:autotransporter domain-containing protein [Burkholderiaceae bacterium]